ncbi:MAG: branched-chain amino acid ABC transporter permease [Alphaproteobacteria bacterium]|jgi:branched-chain amino acid transport system permease protein|nr:branched-chain amino acid ABC transporter permease [Alphaproteobacteria bacterium]
MEGGLAYAIFFLTFASVYAMLALGLNVQWGYTGMLNVGVAAFFAVGAYTTAILTTPASPDHLGGFGLPFWAGFVGAMIVSAALAAGVGWITLNLRSDYLAIASIGIAEIVRLFLKNEAWLTNGVRGIAGIPRPLADLPGLEALKLLALALALVALVYWANERAYRSPWGRVLRAIRDNETATRAMGKNSLAFRVQAFCLGAAIMGLAGAYYAHFVGFISPEAFDPIFATFIVWVMLIAGGSGNNKGAILGAFVIWGVWSGSEWLTTRLPPDFQTQAGAVRVLLIGVLLQVILASRPGGLLPGRPPKPIVGDHGGR